ncbi:MAG: C40 family peptidase [Bacillus sp. (in: firmicutes)]
MKKIILLGILSFVVLFSGLAGSMETQASANHRTKAANTAQKHVGVKYKWGGTTVKGFDCSGLVQYSFRNAGKSLPRTAALMYTKGSAVSKSKLQKGDLVFFKTNGSKVSHVGIFVGNNKFVHSSSSKGVTVTSMNNSYWKTKYVGAKRI